MKSILFLHEIKKRIISVINSRTELIVANQNSTTIPTQKEALYIYTEIAQRIGGASTESSRILSQNHRHLLETRQYSLDAYAPFD